MSLDLEAPHRPVPGGYVRPTWRQAVAELIPAERRRPWMEQWVPWLPTVLLLAVYALLVAPLDNTAMVDEAHVINAGRDYLASWFGAGPGIDHAPYLTGAPTTYPVVAAVLDAIGSLALVRVSSLVLVCATIVLLQSTVTRVTGSYRWGVLSAAAFAITAPVVFVGSLGTPDALCLLLLVAAARAGLTGRSHWSAALAGLLLGLGVVVEYRTLVVAPVPLLLTAVARGVPHAAARPVLALGGMTAAFAAAYALLGEGMRQGVVLAAAALRAPIDPRGAGTLLSWAVLSVGILALLAAAGAFALLRNDRSLRRVAAIGSLLAGGALFPAVQIALGEGLAFHAHTAYAALLLAPLAGFALTNLSRGLFRLVPVAVVLLLMLVPAASRAQTMFAGWADVGPVLAAIEQHGRPGLYLSPAAETISYYTRGDGAPITWHAASQLYTQGHDAIRGAVAERQYHLVAVRSASTASPEQDVLLDALRHSPYYIEIDDLQPGENPATDRWLIYRLVIPLA